MNYLEYINHYKPKLFLIENVPGILSMKTENGVYVIEIIK